MKLLLRKSELNPKTFMLFSLLLPLLSWTQHPLGAKMMIQYMNVGKVTSNAGLIAYIKHGKLHRMDEAMAIHRNLLANTLILLTLNT